MSHRLAMPSTGCRSPLLSRDRFLRIWIIGLAMTLWVSQAQADLRYRPYQPPQRTPAAAPYLINFWVTGQYQTNTGEIIDGSDPVELPEATRTDLQDDLGLNPNVALVLGLKIEHKNRWLPDVRVDFLPFDFHGSHQLSKNLRVGGMSFRANQRVRTRLRAAIWDFTLLYHPLRLGTKKRPWLHVGLGVVGRSTQALLNVQGLGIWRVASERYDVPIIPLGFLSLEVTPYRVFSLAVEARGISDGKNQWWDGTAEMRTWPMGPSAWFGIGARYQLLDVTQDSKGGLKTTIIAGQTTMGLRF